MTRIRTLFYSLKGELLKRLLKFDILKTTPVGVNQHRDKKLIVSLTSYGRRVKAVAPYAIKSLMRQTYQPDKIILWLDKSWNENNIPNAIKKLQDKGLIVKYCNDIRSYKKLIPALIDYPEDLIFTADDDIYYPRNLLSAIIEAHKKSPNRIIGSRGYLVAFDSNKQLIPYNEWKLLNEQCHGNSIVLTGCGGCLYQSKLLYPDVTNDSLFMSLSPQADDIWFFFMEYLANTEIEVSSYCKKHIIPIDSFYQLFHKGSSLASSNCGLSQNDIQIRSIMKHYGITDRILFEKLKIYKS